VLPRRRRVVADVWRGGRGVAVVARFATRATWSRGAIGALAAKLGTTEGGADRHAVIVRREREGGRGTYSVV